MNVFARLKAWNEQRTLRRHLRAVATDSVTFDSRLNAIDYLKRLGTDEAIYGLLRRYSFTSHHSIRDEDEKNTVAEIVTGFGERAIPTLRRFLDRESDVTWPAEILRRLVSEEELVTTLLGLLKDEDLTFRAQKEEKLVDAVRELAKLKDPRIPERVIGLLNLDNDAIRFTAIEILENNPDERARQPLLELYVHPETSARIRNRILDAFVATGWPVKGFHKAVEETLPRGYYLNREGQIRRLGVTGRISG